MAARKRVKKATTATTSPVKAEDTKVKATATKAAEEKKAEPKKAVPEAKAAEPKIAIATKKDETKAIETKAGVMKTAATEEKPVAKKAAAKRTTVKKRAEVKTEMFLQFAGKEFSEKEIYAKVKEVWTKVLKNKVGDLKEVKIYLKPEENAAYFVVNGEVSGKVEL